MKNVGGNYTADNTTGKNHEGSQVNTPLRRLTATSIIGNTVKNEEGEELGKVEDLMINLNLGCIEYAILEFGAHLNMGGKLFAIPYNELLPDTTREIFILNRGKEYLKKAPGFNKDHWPDTNDHNNYYSNASVYWESPVWNEPTPIAAPAPGSPLSAYY
ncbi:MAG TPA: PRC-barrel domain-containing protein [Cytophagales bacterium]|nr:PRC-barrel domain-containing protein [Cytophagales bacterium]